MPIVYVDINEGRTVDQKRALVMELTEAIVRTLGVNQEQVRIIINDMKHENYASGGVLRLDRK